MTYNFLRYTIKNKGIQIHTISADKTAAPQPLKNDPIPIGETGIGRYGKKYLVLSNGANKAIPNPPFVNASNIPWDIVIKKKKINFAHHNFEKILSFLKNINIIVNTNKKAPVQCGGCHLNIIYYLLPKFLNNLCINPEIARFIAPLAAEEQVLSVCCYVGPHIIILRIHIFTKIPCLAPRTIFLLKTHI